MALTRARQSATTLRAALRNGDICRVEIVWAVAIFAEWAHLVALGVFAYRQGGASLVGVAGLVRLLPAGILAPFASSVGDRVRRERLLLALVVIEAAALGGSGAAAARDSQAGVLALAALIGVTSTLIRPAVQSVLPSLARTPAELVASNSATSTMEGLGALCGPLAVGAAVGTSAVFMATGAAVLASATVLFGLRTPARIPVGEVARADKPDEAVVGHTTRGGAVRAGAAGLRVVFAHRSLRLLIGLTGTQCFVRGCLNVLVVVTAFRLMHAGSSTVGYLNAAVGVGGLVGAMAASTLNTKRLAVIFGVALLCWGAPITVIAAVPSLAPALLSLVIVGTANAFEDISLITLVQRQVPDELLSSVLGVLWGLAMTSVAVGSVVVAGVVDAIGPRTTLAVVGLLLPLLVLTSGRRLGTIDRSLPPSDRLDLLENLPIFAPLSLTTKERLATALEPLEAGAGEVIMREGDTGDRFYIVGTGRLAVLRGGVHILTVGPGEYFGEIALLYNVARTATVKAEAHCTLYALSAPAFLGIFSGHPAAAAEVHRVAAERRATTGSSGALNSGSGTGPTGPL